MVSVGVVLPGHLIDCHYCLYLRALVFRKSAAVPVLPRGGRRKEGRKEGGRKGRKKGRRKETKEEGREGTKEGYGEMDRRGIYMYFITLTKRNNL